MMSASSKPCALLAVAFALAGCGVDDYNSQIEERRKRWRTEFRREQALGKVFLDKKRLFSVRPPASLEEHGTSGPLARFEGTVGDEQAPRFLFIYASNVKGVNGPAFRGRAEGALARSIGHRVWPRPPKTTKVEINGREMAHYTCSVKMSVMIGVSEERKPSTPGPAPPGAGPPAPPGPEGQPQPATKQVKRRQRATKQMRFWVYVHESEASGPPPKTEAGKPPPPQAWRILLAYGCQDRGEVKDSFAEAQKFSIESLKVGAQALAGSQEPGVGPASKKGSF